MVTVLRLLVGTEGENVRMGPGFLSEHGYLFLHPMKGSIDGTINNEVE